MREQLKLFLNTCTFPCLQQDQKPLEFPRGESFSGEERTLDGSAGELFTGLAFTIFGRRVPHIPRALAGAVPRRRFALEQKKMNLFLVLVALKYQLH